MLTLIDDNGERQNFFVMDIHHHIGSEENVRNLNPKEPNGSYDFFRAILYGSEYKVGLIEELKKKEKYKFYYKEGMEFVKMPNIMAHLYEIDQKVSKAFKESMVVDQSVAFPMHDVFRKNDGIEYRTSNKRISQVTNTYPNSLRFIGFGRINPNEGEDAIEELHRLVREDGLRGLKLHTKSEKFKLDIPELKKIMKITAYYGIPIIFHTDWANEREKIYETVVETATELWKEGKKNLIKGLKAIIGHCGWSSNPRLFEILGNPHIFGEISGMHGDGVYNFFESAREHFTTYFFENTTIPEMTRGMRDEEELKKMYAEMLSTTKWCDKLLFGSDIPFLNQNNAIDVITTLMRRDLNLRGEEIQNILGHNSLRIVPPKFASPVIKIKRKEPKPAIRKLSSTLHYDFIKTLLSEIEYKMSITNFDLLIETYPVERVRLDDVVLTITDKDGNGNALLLSSLFGGKLESIIPLDSKLVGLLKERIVDMKDIEARKIMLTTRLGKEKLEDFSGGNKKFIEDELLGIKQ
ncbi:MAG: amidohydrolase family protein [Candidatus Thermoplasmatota archaeon]